MAKPPDLNSPTLKWDPTKYGKLTAPGPKYLIITRTNENTTLSNVSPFLIKKAIDGTCGEVAECKQTRNGQILVKTNTHLQANKLMTLTDLSNSIQVNVTVHKFLNQSRGVIYCNGLRGIEEKDILEELRSQKVCEIKKILKKTNDCLAETGLIIITFETIELPTKINIGYESVGIRPYIPPPMLCRSCFNYGHPTKYCKSKKMCPNCCKDFHTNELTEEICENNKACINCTKNNLPHNHTPTDKKCPIFIKESEIQSIKTIYKVDNKTARNIYAERHQHEANQYSTVLKTSPPKETNNTASTHKESLGPKRPLTTYSSLSESEPDPATSAITHLSNNYLILPKSTSKRAMTELKRAAKNKSTDKTKH